MSDTNLNFDDELLSAYVDGELTGAQLAQVEQQLADDPRARQLVDELHALSQAVRSLPQEKLGEDLRASVLQRAEQAMLLGSEQPVVPISRETLGARRWMWAALALAASLLLAVLLPTAKQEEQPLASAKPALGDAFDDGLGDAAREAPQMEAAKEGSEADEAALAGVSEVPAASSSFISGTGGGGIGGVAGIAVEELADADRSNEEFQPTCVVHITLNNSTDGVEQFDRLLVSQGIVLRPGGAARRASALSARSASDSGPEANLTELVLVEAPTEQIEGVLEASNLDTRNYAEVRLTEQSESTELLLDRWRQWERSGKQLAQSKLQNLKRKAKSAIAAQQGWATRIDAGQYLGDKLSGNSGKPLAKKEGRRAKKIAAQDPVQVLFILRAATPAAAPADR